MEDKFLSDLEYTAVLALLGAETATPPGALCAASLRPWFDPPQVERENALTIEAVRHLEHRGALPFGTIPDPAPLIDRLSVEGSILTSLEVQGLLTVMKAGRGLKSALAEPRSEYPRLWDEAKELPDLGNLIRYLDGKIGSTGEMADHASDALRALRQEIQRRTGRLQSMLDSLLGRSEVARALQDDFVSIRSERHVIPIRAEARAALPGIVHGVSGSGATVFVEPIETVDLNNEIVTLRDRESAEVRRLLEEYSALFRGRRAELAALVDGIGRLDLIMARGRLARSQSACPAQISTTGALELAGARHPLVEASLRLEGGSITPLDFALPAGTRVVMISGPNTGGKTVTLKTVGLLSLMFQSGLLVPAERALLPVFRRISIDIGDRQSISEALSTFSARIRTIAAMTDSFEPPALVLLDEVGTGTDPEEGVALGTAIIDYFRVRGATVIATTHLEALKAYAAMTASCANASMQFDEATFTPTYRLVQGVPGRSGALEVAARLGLPDEVLAAARERRGRAGEMVSGYLARLQDLAAEFETRTRVAADRQAELEAARAALTASFEKREEALRRAVASEIEMALGALRAEGERYLASLKDRELAQRMRREEARAAAALRAEARRSIRRVAGRHAPTDRPPGDLAPGAMVFVEGLGMRGMVEQVQGERVAIVARGKRLSVPRDDCIVEAREKERAPARDPRLGEGVSLNRRPAPAREEIQLRGLTVDEALGLVDKFLDDAYLSTLSRVRLVHGVGTGRLKRAITEFLSGHPHVAGFASAPENEGGAGVTIVTLRP